MEVNIKLYGRLNEDMFMTMVGDVSSPMIGSEKQTRDERGSELKGLDATAEVSAAEGAVLRMSRDSVCLWTEMCGGGVGGR